MKEEGNVYSEDAVGGRKEQPNGVLAKLVRP
jgi:hypothetical protein